MTDNELESLCFSFMIFLLLHDFYLWKEFRNEGWNTTADGKTHQNLKKNQGIQPYFRFNSSGTDPDFGTGLNSTDGGEKDRQELSLWGEICSFCSSKSQNVTVPGQLLFLWPQPRGCQDGLNHLVLLSAQKRGGKQSEMAWGIIQLSQKIFGKGRIVEGQTKAGFGGHWRRRKSSLSSQHKREVQHQNPALCRERAAGSGLGLGAWRISWWSLPLPLERC